MPSEPLTLREVAHAAGGKGGVMAKKKTVPRPAPAVTAVKRVVTLEEPCEVDREGFFTLECPNCTNHQIRFQGKGAERKPQPGEPECVTFIPEDIYYDLTMNEVYGGASQDISLTREEYVALKAHLAKLRGYLSA
jgi:hypothetical protein